MEKRRKESTRAIDAAGMLHSLELGFAALTTILFLAMHHAR